MKRLFSAWLALVLTAGIFFGIPVSAAEEKAELYTYEVNQEEVTITKVDPSISGDISIPAELEGYPVTAIGDDAFSNCGSLTGVIIPNSVISIGEAAFYNCSSLTAASIPDSVNSIGYGTFYKCSKLTQVVIPEGVTVIEGYTFAYCTSLNAVTIPNSVTKINEYAFYGCNNLSAIQIPDGATDIGEAAFYECSSLTNVHIPESITSISNYVFAKCTGLDSITIPNTVTTIGDYAFAWCSGVNSVVVPDSVIRIGNKAFASCGGLNCVTVGDGVIITGEAVFYQCTSLTHVILGNSLSIVGNHMFNDCVNLTEIVIPESVLSIGFQAFSGCDNLNSVQYCGNEAQWKNILINSLNECLTNAQIHYNYKPLVNGKVEYWRLILQDQIGVYFQMKYTEGIKLDKDAYVEVAVAGEISKVPVHTALDSLLVNVAAAQMTDEISICVVSGDGIRGETAVYSVKAYADQVLAGNYDNATKNLVASMLSYGAKAQEQFQYRLDAKADSGVNCVLSAVPGTADVPMEVTGEIEGISLYGASVLYDSKLALRYYFETEDISGYTFTVNGKQLQPVEKSGRFYVEISDILPQNIDKFFTVTVQDAQGNAMCIVYNPLNYVVRMYNKANTSQETKNLLQALYTYHLAAKDYTN